MITTLHRYLGLFMILPFVVWAITGTYFFIKPGYSEAYQSLEIKQYPLATQPPDISSLNADEVRWLHSIIGEHLLIKRSGTWQQLNWKTLTPSEATEQQVRRLIDDAIAGNERYGQIKTIENLKVATTTGINITLDWQQMRLSQRGKDTEFINQMYQLHYLQWTGIQAIDKVLGLVGLGLVLMLAGLGLVMTIKSRKTSV